MQKALLILLLFLMELTFSQNPYYNTIDKASGLPSNSVYDVFQDSKGFMWFATGKGLCRFDGNFIETYVADFQTSKSGSCIQEDKFGRIWYENFDGYLYYVENDTLKALNQEKSTGYFKYGITSSHLILLHADEINYYELKTLALTKKVKLKLPNIRFTFCKDDLFYVFGDNLKIFDSNGRYKQISFPEYFIQNFSTIIVGESANGLFIASKYTNEYYLFENGNFTKKKNPITNDFIQNISFTKDENWICSTKGVIKIDAKKNEVKRYFTDKNISYVYKDNQNNYWISTITEGVLFIENFNTQLYDLPLIPFALSNSKENLIIGTDKEEVFTLNKKSKLIQSIYKGKSNHATNQILYNENQNEIYYTSSKLNILKNNKLKTDYTIAAKEIVPIDSKYYSFAASNISGIFAAGNSKSEWDSIFNSEKSIADSLFKAHFFVTNANGKSTAYNSINKTIYYATNNGLIAVSKKEKKELKFNNETLYLNKIGNYNDRIFGLSNNEKLYAVSNSNKVTEFSLPNDLKNKKIEKIDVEENFLFAFTNTAIYEINLLNNQFKKLITLTNDIEIYDIKLVDNLLYFASSKGIIEQQRTLQKATIKPQLVINKILVNNSIYNNENIKTLDYNENNIIIEFTVLSFIPNIKQDVLYRINNSKWQKLDHHNRKLILSSLSPNDYLVELKVNGHNATLKQIKFTIEKPFWYSNLAILAYILLLGFVFISFYKWQIFKIKRKNTVALEKIKLEKNLNQSKLKAIKSQMNPHFFYNALNTLQSYILSNEKKQAIEYLSKFSNLTRTILEMTEKETISIADEAKTLGLYLDIEKARFEKDFNYTINVAETIDSEAIKIPSMLLQPYVENAVKHGLLHKENEKILFILFEKHKNNIVITIDDNGIGRQKSMQLNQIRNKKHQSFATAATKNRIDLLNQFTKTEITIEFTDKFNLSKQATGTTVTIKIPITY
uniref:histidine kinase n=1 Tax=Flavobacterium sp. TaxID=239 RepID=UPI00404AB56C